jgi:hypothetical protein
VVVGVDEGTGDFVGVIVTVGVTDRSMLNVCEGAAGVKSTSFVCAAAGREDGTGPFVDEGTLAQPLKTTIKTHPTKQVRERPQPSALWVI